MVGHISKNEGDRMINESIKRAYYAGEYNNNPVLKKLAEKELGIVKE